MSLFSIDEETDEEGGPFVAVVERILDREPPLIDLVAKEVDRGAIQRVAEILSTCARAQTGFLHVNVQWREGGVVRSTSGGFLLKLQTPHGPKHAFVPVEVGSLDEARRMRPEKFTIRFAVELLD